MFESVGVAEEWKLWVPVAARELDDVEAVWASASKVDDLRLLETEITVALEDSDDLDKVEASEVVDGEPLVIAVWLLG